MIWNTWEANPRRYPYFIPDGFGESIFLRVVRCCFFCFVPEFATVSRAIKWGSWIMVVSVLNISTLIHGNPGGWQYSYRYAMVLLPWIFMIMLQDGPPRWAWTEKALFGVSRGNQCLGNVSLSVDAIRAAVAVSQCVLRFFRRFANSRRLAKFFSRFLEL